MRSRIAKVITQLLLGNHESSPDSSISITNPLVINLFKANSNNTFLVSFPRTGSHWLRMVMELYFGRPSLTRVFYYHDRTDYLTLHTHDLDLDVRHPRVLYLYREPVATIYSQLSYHEEDLDDQERIAYWSELYGQHLAKWLVLEDFTIQKTVLRYEGMRHDLVTEFEKVVNHFGESLNSEHLKEAEARVSKEEVKRKTQHDLHVIQLKSEYRVKREAFRKHWGSVIWDIMLAGRPYLREYFP